MLGKVSTNHHIYNSNGQSGLSLIEITIALLLMAIALFALAKWQVISLQHVDDALLQSQAEIRLQDLANRIIANPENVSTEITQWQKINKQLLPQPSFIISGNDPYEIQLTWSQHFNKKPQTLTTKVHI